MTAVANLQPANANLPPLHNVEAEQALLGAILANNEVWHRVADWLKPTHFSDALHGRIYDACGRLISKGQTASAISLRRVFDQDGALTDIGGGKYLVDLSMAVISIRGAEDFASIILDLAQRRLLLTVGTEMLDDARVAVPGRSALDVVEATEAKLLTIADATGGIGTDKSSAEASMTALQIIERAMKVGHGGLSTGFKQLDRRTGGLHDTDLIIVAGRPNMGKSDLAVALADNVAIAARAARRLDPQAPMGAVWFSSLEMSADQIAMRQMARRTQLSTHAMRGGYLTGSQFDLVADAQRDIADLPLVIDEKPSATVANVLSGARRAMRQHGRLSLIIVDYLHLMNADSHHYRGNKVNEVGEITKGLKGIAKTLGVPVIALSQLSRQCEARDDKRPMLQDLRDSGSIEQDADSVWFVYRDEYYLSRGEPKQSGKEKDGEFGDRYARWQRDVAGAANQAEIIVAKQRHGPIGTVKLGYFGKYSHFDNLHDDGPIDHAG